MGEHRKQIRSRMDYWGLLIELVSVTPITCNSMGGKTHTSLRKVGSESSWLWLKLLRAIWLDTKSDGGRRSGLLWRQRSGCWLLGNRRHWGRRCIGLVAVAIDTSGLRLQCRRKNRIDTSLHWLLELPVSTKACGLRPKSLEPSLLRGHTTKRLLLLLLDTEL